MELNVSNLKRFFATLLLLAWCASSAAQVVRAPPVRAPIRTFRASEVQEDYRNIYRSKGWNPKLAYGGLALGATAYAIHGTAYGTVATQVGSTAPTLEFPNVAPSKEEESKAGIDWNFLCMNDDTPAARAKSSQFGCHWFWFESSKV